MEQNLERCPIHDEHSFLFCKTCKRISCSKCKECESHSAQTTTELIEKYKDKLQPNCLEQYEIGALEILKTNDNILLESRNNLQVIVEELEVIEEKISQSKEGIENDSKLITEAIQHLRSVGEEAFTTALLDATQKAAEALDIESEITKETERYKQEMERLKENVERHTSEIRTLEMEVEWLNKITTTEKKSLDEELELALSLCLARELFSPSKLIHRASEYKAFPTVDKVFDIESVEKQELVEAGLGVKISEPVVVKRGLENGDIFSSLSHNGVLATYYYASGHKYQLTDLVAERQINIDVESWTHMGFFDDSLIALTWYKLLGVCSVEEMFLNRSVKILKRIGDVEVRPWADVSLLHSTRILLFSSASKIPYELNVDTKVMKKLDVGKKIYEFASLTGIDIGVKGMFREEGNNNFTYSLNNDNSTSLVLEHECSHALDTFIASSSDSKDIREGMKIYSDGTFIKMIDKRQPTFGCHSYRSIVRIFHDIFLVNDKKLGKWCLVKIIVQ